MRRSILALLTGGLLPAVAFGQVPAKLAYQGRLVSADGSPAAGVVSMTFKLFKVEAGGTEVWSETQSHVALTAGYYSVFLGDVTSLTSALFDGSDLFFEVTIKSNVLTPRQRIASVPYAIRAGSVAGVATNSTLVGSGTSAAPLGIDVVHYGFTFEADACTNAAAGTSVVVNDPTASGGKACEAAYGATTGRMFGIHASDLGHLIAAQPSQVDFRLKVAANTSAATILAINCAAVRAGSDNWVVVGKPLSLAPNDFPSAGAWQTFSLGCDWRPDDVNQFLGVEDYVPKISDVYVDFVQVRPSRQPMAGLLLDSGGFNFTLASGYTSGTIAFNVPFTQPPAITCSESGSAGGWVVCKFDSVTKTGAVYAINAAFNSTAATYSGHLSWIAVGR